MADDLAIIVATVVNIATELYKKILPEDAVCNILFDGQIQDKHKTKYSLKETTDRYKESINGFNRAVAFNVGFALIALYVYLILQPANTVTIPFLGLPITRSVWIYTAPLISLVLQAFIFTSFIWYLVLRQGLKLLYKEVGAIDDFGDVTNILLDGALGQIWIISRIITFFGGTGKFLWYLPALILVLSPLMSPLIISFYFIFQLANTQNTSIFTIILIIIYLVLLLFYMLLFALLVLIISILGKAEFKANVGQNPQIIP